MSKFLDYLGDPQWFSSSQWVVAQESMTREEFYQLLKNEFHNTGITSPDDIGEDWVHCHLGYDDDGNRVNGWWLGCGNMKGSKAVWVF